MYNNEGFEALENLLNSEKKPDNHSRTIDILTRLSTDCFSPFITSDELRTLADTAQQLCPELLNFPEWLVAKASLENKNFYALTSQVSTCIKKLENQK